MRKHGILVLFYLGIATICLYGLKGEVSAQGPTLTPIAQTLTAAPSATPPPALTPAPTNTPNPPLSYGDALDTYEKIATETIRTSDRVLELAKWILGSTIALLTIMITVSGSIIAYLVKKAQTASDTAQSALEEAKVAANAAKESSNAVTMLTAKLESQSQEAQTQIGRARAQLEELEKISTRAQDEYRQTTNDLKQWRQAYKHDIENLRASLLLVQIEELDMDLYGEDANSKRKAIQALIAMTDSSNRGFVRQRSIRTLGNFVIREPDKQVLERLNEIATGDPSIGLRRIAQELLSQAAESK